MSVNFGRAALGGLVGTLAMTAMMYMVAPMMGLHMDIAAMLGSMLGGSWAAGLVLHFVNGTLVFPALYAYALAGWLPGSPVVKGAMWGVALWLLAQLVAMPMMGAGVFSSAMGGMMAVMGSLVTHLIYGGLFGALAGAPEPRVAHS
jgi:hypothetical protein